MLNWPIPGGTSLHFVGGALAGIMLGVWNGFLATKLREASPISKMVLS